MKCLYIGLGVMGGPIAGCLSKTFPTSVWNRTTSKALAHAEQYQTQALTGTSPFQEGLSEMDFIMTCLPTSKEVHSMAKLLLSTPLPRKESLIWIDNTSGQPSDSNQIAAELAEQRISFIDAPVSGGRKGANAAALTIMVSGEKQAVDHAMPIFQAMGKNINYLGPDVGTAHAVKGLNNLLFASNLLMAMKVAQSLVRQGINPDAALRTMLTSSGGSNAMTRVHEYVTHDKTIDYRFLSGLLVKDMDIGLGQVHERFPSDPSYEMFKTIRDIYAESTQEKGEATADVFDVYDFIERS